MPTVGVAGFLLGGGISTLSSRYGFGADMVSVWEVRKDLQVNPQQYLQATNHYIYLGCYSNRRCRTRIPRR